MRASCRLWGKIGLGGVVGQGEHWARVSREWIRVRHCVVCLNGPTSEGPFTPAKAQTLPGYVDPHCAQCGCLIVES